MWILSLSTLQKSAALKATGAAVSRDQRKGNGGSHAVRNSNASRPVRETPGHKKNDDFRDQYAHAREEQADKLFREIIEIADDASGDYVTTSDGKRIVDHENINRSRLRVDARKWAAARLAPKKYGDHISHDVHGSTTLNYQPAILIKVGDGTTTRSEDAPAPKAGRGVLLGGNGDIVRER